MSKWPSDKHISKSTGGGAYCVDCGEPVNGPHNPRCHVAHPISSMFMELANAEKVPDGEIRITKLLTVPWKNTTLIFALATDGCLYRQCKKGWTPVSMKIIQADTADDGPTDQEQF